MISCYCVVFNKKYLSICLKEEPTSTLVIHAFCSTSVANLINLSILLPTEVVILC